MSIKEIADKLVAYCREGNYEAAQKELYANDAVSIEEQPSPAFAKETKGLKAIEEKGKVWAEMVEEVYGGSVSEPVLADSSFAVSMMMDVKTKGMGRMKMTELCIYKVKDGKIVSEEFIS